MVGVDRPGNLGVAGPEHRLVPGRHQGRHRRAPRPRPEDGDLHRAARLQVVAGGQAAGEVLRGDEGHQRADAESGATLGQVAGGVFGSGRSGHVDVGPGHRPHELAEQEGGGDAAGLAGTADVAHVGHIGVDVAPVVVGQRHRPRRLAGTFPGAPHLFDEGIVGPEEGGDVLAQGDHRRPGQRGQVDDGVRLRLGGQREPIGQHQPALGVGVEHLDGLAAAGGEHVAGLGGRIRRACSR